MNGGGDHEKADVGRGGNAEVADGDLGDPCHLADEPRPGSQRDEEHEAPFHAGRDPCRECGVRGRHRSSHGPVPVLPEHCLTARIQCGEDHEQGHEREADREDRPWSRNHMLERSAPDLEHARVRAHAGHRLGL